MLQVGARQDRAGGQSPVPERVAPVGEGGPRGLGSTQPSAASLTFVQGGQLQGDADDPHQVLGGDEGAQDGPDPDGFPLSCLDKLQCRVGE